MNNIRTYADDFLEFFHQRYKLKNKPQIIFQDDIENSKNPLGKTAYYDPEAQSITVFTTGRHIKDCLRSLAHELVHHLQNERGEFDNSGPTFQGYAQKDPHLRKMESEANEKGSMCLRDWEDMIKQQKQTIYESKLHKGDAKMSIKEWKNSEMNEMLMEKWGFTPKEGSFLTETGGMATYDLSNADYATGQLEETPEDLEEEELGEELEAHPHAPEARLEEKEELQEDQPYTAKKEKAHADKRKSAEKRGAEGTLAKTKGHGRVDFVNEEELEEEENYGKGKHEYRRHKEDGVEHKAGDKDHHYKDYEVMNEEKLREIIKNVIKELTAE